MTTRSPLVAFAFRLRPGDDLKRELTAFAASESLQAGVILSCVGSLTQVRMRYANRADGAKLVGHFEIVSLVGTLSPDGLHAHLAVADSDGSLHGGHLLDGCLIHTTAEVVVGELTATQFTRVLDEATGYRELAVLPRPGVAPTPAGN